MAAKRVGVRELRQRASELLRRVERGETIEITSRGHPVALLTPIQPKSRFEQLLASGDIEPPTIDPSEPWPEPLALEPGEEPPSETLRRLREHER